MNTLNIRALAAAASSLLLAACGQPLLYAEIDVPSVAITQSMPDMPGAPPIDLPALTVNLELSIGDLGLGARSERSSVTLNGAVLQLVGPAVGTTFAGLRTVELRLLPAAGSSQPEGVLATFDRARDGAAGDRIALRATDQVNLLPYLSADRVRVQVVAAGVPPGPVGSTWSSDLTVDLHVVARVDVR